MRGDILIISEKHRQVAGEVTGLVLEEVQGKEGKYIMTVSGESGAGKSEIAAAIAEQLEKHGIKCYIFQQDDYFVYPPLTNARVRKENIAHVGMGEVKLDLLDQTIQEIREGKNVITKPLVFFEEDRIGMEEIDLTGFPVIIIEGTYVSVLKNVDCKVFIDRNMNDTRADRLKRNREKQDEYLERILAIEHGIISRHKEYANIVITRDFTAIRKTKKA